MGHTINVTVRNKIAVAQKNALYICGNSDFVIVFDFDEEWNEHDHKTARFIHNGSYQDVIFTGNTCPVPIISNAYNIKVGVYAGDLRTTTPAHISAKKSILCDGGLPAAPPDDVYTQIMEELDTLNGDIGTAVAEYLKDNPIEGAKFKTDETLTLEDGILSVNRATEVEEDNTLPITSAAVYTTVGNISAILDAI